MSDLLLDILKDIQRRSAAFPRIQAEAASTARAVASLRQDVRMIRAAINDLAHPGFRNPRAKFDN